MTADRTTAASSAIRRGMRVTMTATTGTAIAIMAIMTDGTIGTIKRCGNG